MYFTHVFRDLEATAGHDLHRQFPFLSTRHLTPGFGMRLASLGGLGSPGGSWFGRVATVRQ